MTLKVRQPIMAPEGNAEKEDHISHASSFSFLFSLLCYPVEFSQVVPPFEPGPAPGFFRSKAVFPATVLTGSSGSGFLPLEST